MNDFIEKTKYIHNTYKNNKKLYDKKSKIGQHIQVFNNSFFGNILVIDNDLQLTEHDESNYHEMIVHVPLNYIENKINILIIGGGDGGTLREVCKHKNVKEIIMVEIDKEVIDVCKKYFKKCSNSFNDKRLTLIIDDAALWIEKNVNKYNNYFDIILLDSTDFNKSDSLFTNNFYININKVLNYYGIFCFNCLSLLWEKSAYKDVMDEMKDYFNYSKLYQVFQPTYHSGNYTFCINSNYIDFINTPINVNKFKKKKIKCTYYNIDIHKSSFNLPNEFTKQLLKDKRLGTSYMIDIKNCSKELLDNKDYLIKFLRNIINLFSLTEVNEGLSYHIFKPQGLTINILLKESHITIHTWPEKGKCTIDIFSCSDFKWSLEFSSKSNYYLFIGGTKQLLNKFDIRYIIINYLKVSLNDIKISWQEREI